jgi:hypothetical protein
MARRKSNREQEIEKVRRQDASIGRRNPHANDLKSIESQIIRAADELDRSEFEQLLISVLGLQPGSEKYAHAMQGYDLYCREKP